ncbi:MAG: hypothetical protein AB1668_04745, partial [Nanoarchaeota archaeon]
MGVSKDSKEDRSEKEYLAEELRGENTAEETSPKESYAIEIIVGTVSLFFIVVSLAIYLLLGPSLKTVLLSTALFAVIGIAYASWEMSAANRLHRELKKASPFLDEEAVAEHYAKIYRLYAQLPEEDKPDFHSEMRELTEKIESQLVAEKALEKLLREAGRGSLKTQKSMYSEIYRIYRT